MHRYNTFWKRFAAIIIDSIVLSPLTFICRYAEGSANNSIFLFGSLLFSAIYTAYFIVLHGRYGQTLGKKIMGIKVVDVNEVSLIGITRAIIRELPWLIAVAGISIYLFIVLLLIPRFDLQTAKDRYNDLIFVTLFTWMLIEFITMFTNYKRRAVHDYLANSVVLITDN